MRLTTILALAAMSLVPQTAPPVITGSVSGRVFDLRTKMPVAEVKVGSRELGWILTHSDGRYTIRGIAAGRVTIGLEGDFNGQIYDITVAPKEVTVLDGREETGIDFHARFDRYSA